MRRLIRANMRRWCKSNLYWFFAFLVALFCVLVCVNQYRYMIKYDVVYTLDVFLYGSFQLVGIGFAVVISVYVGTEYSDGTIRNKLIVGRRRLDIYLASMAVCALGSVFIALLAAAVTAAVGYPLFGGLKNSVAFTALMLFIYCMAVVAYASIYNLIAMLTANKTHSSIINILLAFVLIFVEIYLYAKLSAPSEIPGYVLDAAGELQFISEPNPAFLEGMEREVFQFFMDFLPSGQAMQVANLEVLHPLRMILCSLGIIAGTNTLGVFLFRRMDIR